ncbi:hypothetical protein TH66_13525 [Carbonactinospora thermoautotrophica]|uniref:FtsK domain-containing protein n=2 Tax=Carbonactinospora thermoautotrophica TaxID=1469144 RepID=A0A132N0Z4_9ACTN|nr:hypothetical protein [Carbonactinospora thermoautotrophica]KWX03799.1 hypothetical protein TH66_13525 [Carbonactinospora thermoautotrophica]
MARRDTRREHRLPTGHQHEITAGRVALNVAKAYGRWVRRSPDTRGLATALVALYLAGGVAHLAGADPLLLGALGAPAGLAAWVGTYKAHRSARYSATVAATAAGVPIWLATAAHYGITHMPVLVGYTTAAALAWSGYTWSDVLKTRRAWKTQQTEWDTLATAAGLDGSRLVAVEDTRLGQRFRIDIRATGRTARQLTRGDLAERIAAHLALPAERVRVTIDPKHAGQIFILVQTRDPWAEPVPHPALTGGAVEPVAGRRRSILDGPLVLGLDPDTGHDLELVVFDRAGGRHTMIVAATGGGKTTLYNNVVEQATARTDVLVWAIDLGKGTIPTIWGDALDAGAGIDEYDRALAILTWATIVIKERSRATGGRNHTPSPTAPVILILVDEMDTLLGLDSPIGHKAKPLVEDIVRRGRSAGVLLAAAGQRGTVQHTGSKDPHANAGNKIVLRVNRPSEMGNVIPDWEIQGMPNMATYAQGVRGVALVVDAENNWRAGRVRDMSDLDAVQALAARRGRPTATLEPDIAALLPGYLERHRIPATVGHGTVGHGTVGHGAPAGRLVPLPRHDHDGGGNDGRAGGDGGHGWGVDPGDEQAIDRLAKGLVAEVEAKLAGMPTPPDRPTSLADLVAAKAAFDAAEDNDADTNRTLDVPDHIARPILTLLAERGADGASPADLVKATGKGESTVRRWLAIMRDHDLIVSRGSTRATRYYLPEHDPEPDHGK